MNPIQVIGLGILLSAATCMMCYNEANMRTELRKLSYAELTEWFLKNKYVNDSTILRDTLGNILDKSVLQKVTPDDYFVEYYVDDQDILREAVIRRSTQGDKLFFENVLALKLETSSTVQHRNVNCDSVGIYLTEVYKNDQLPRQQGRPDTRKDSENLNIVMSILKDCGMPTEEQEVTTVFLVIQHSRIEIMEEIFPLLKKAAAEGLLDIKTLALMEDRIMYNRTRMQKYGTQYKKLPNGDIVILPITDSLTVDLRRKEIGLAPLQEYIRQIKESDNPSK